MVPEKWAALSQRERGERVNVEITSGVRAFLANIGREPWVDEVVREGCVYEKKVFDEKIAKVSGGS